MSELIEALAKAQAAFPTIAKTHTAKVKTKTGTDYSYTYANLSDTLGVVLPVLLENGIVLLQPIVNSEHGCEVQTVLAGHGDRIVASMPLDVARLSPQEVGSLISYYRRYLLTSLLSLAVDDDDGKAATTAKRAPRPRAEAPRLAEEHKQAFRDWFDGLPDEVQAERKPAFKTKFGKLDDVPAAKWGDVEKFMAGEA